MDRLFYVLNVGLLGFTFLLVIYPLIYVVSSSFSDALEVVAGTGMAVAGQAVP